MSFASLEYLFLFLPIVFVFYFLLNKVKLYTFAKCFLLIASLFFYGAYKLDYVLIIIFSILFNYFIVKIFERDIKQIYKKITLIMAVSGNIFILLFFKYFNSVIEVLRDYSFISFDAMQIILPLGISFYTLQQISYIVDCYKGNIKNYNILDYSLFICFFPQLVAGPIVRHQEMIPQFNNLKNRVINPQNIYIGFFLITIGLLKKTVFADEFVSFINYIVNNRIYNDFYLSWLLSLTKTLQVYFDFSGYCDIALGSASLFNISLPLNFNSPFQAKSVSEFWKRNNMTLIRFLKVYVYRPMGGEQKGLLKTCCNVLCMFLLYGLWMGVNLVSILYGLMHGFYVCINKIWERTNIKIPSFIATLITFVSVIFSAPFAFEKNIGNSFTIFKSMLTIDATYTHSVIDGGTLYFMVAPPSSAHINLCPLFISLIIVLFFKNSNQLAKLYAKSNNLLYTFLLSIIFIYAVLCTTRNSSFVYFVF